MPFSIAGGAAMDSPFLYQLKKQTSSFFKHNIRKARLALTDVTLAQLLTKEVTNKSRRDPDPRIMHSISKAAFEVDEYSRIVKILHQRFRKFDKKRWLESYKALILLEHLLIHGPKSSADEFQIDREFIQQMCSFQSVNKKGFNWGLTLKSKAGGVLQLLEGGPYLQGERDRLRSLSHGTGVYGSIDMSSSSINSRGEASYSFRRSNSDYEDYSRRANTFSQGALNYMNYDAQLHEQPTKTSRADERSKREIGNMRLPIEENTVTVTASAYLPEEYEPLLEDSEEHISLGKIAKYSMHWVQF